MNRSILIVEDDEFFREALKDSLSRHGFKVSVAADGKSARLILNLSSFDLILSDIQMPHMTGVELLAWVKENKPSVPVVLMTGFSQIVETKKAHELGAAGFIPKPFTDKDVLELIKEIFPNNNPSDDVADTAPKSSESSAKEYVEEYQLKIL